MYTYLHTFIYIYIYIYIYISYTYRDKDDDDAMDFVLCASNLRANAFGIEMQTSFRCKQMAGNNILPI